MSNLNLILFNNSKTILINQNKVFDDIIKSIKSEISILKQTSETNTQNIILDLNEQNDEPENEISDDEKPKEHIRETKQELADMITDALGDQKTLYEQNILDCQNLKRKSKQIIESIESKIESPDDDETTEDDIKNELIKLNDQYKLLLSKITLYICTSNYIDHFIKNKHEINGIVFLDN